MEAIDKESIDEKRGNCHMNEYELLGGLHELIDADVDKKVAEWLDKHNVNYWLLYPLAMIELGVMNNDPETTENLLKRCVTSFVYAKAINNGRKLYLKKFNIPGLKRYMKEYENVLLPIFQNYRFSREINDINPVSKAKLTQIDVHRYQVTTSLVTDKYQEENFYFYGVDDPKSSEIERKQALDLHLKFWNKIILEQKIISKLEKNIDDDLYQGCIKIVEKDIDKWASNVRSAVFDNPRQIIQVIAFFYYQSLLRSISIRIGTLYGEEYIDNAPDIIMVFDKMQCIRDITSSSNLNIKKVERIVEYFINRGNTNILEFPLFEIEDKLVTIPSLFLVNDWQFTIVNGHYAKNIPIKNREKTLSIVTEGRIEKTLQDVSNIATVKTKPYSYKDANGELQCSDIDFAIYDKIRNIILVIEAKWIDKHYSDEIDKRYGMIFKTLNGIFTKQIKKHREFLSQRENIDFIFEDDERYIRSEMEPQIYYLAVDKRNQMHIDEMHMISEYMMIYFLKKYSKNHELNLLDLWKEISSLKTKFEYIITSSDFYEIKVGEDIVLVGKDDLFWE